jgi:hypothetical protein
MNSSGSGPLGRLIVTIQATERFGRMAGPFGLLVIVAIVVLLLLGLAIAQFHG